MNKNEFICNLNAEINNGEALLDRFERFQEYHDDLGDGMAHFGTEMQIWMRLYIKIFFMKHSVGNIQ